MTRQASRSKSTGLGKVGPAGSITKSEAVPRTMADGVDQPADRNAYILSQFEIEMGPQHFGAVKSSH